MINPKHYEGMTEVEPGVWKRKPVFKDFDVIPNAKPISAAEACRFLSYTPSQVFCGALEVPESDREWSQRKDGKCYAFTTALFYSDGVGLALRKRVELNNVGRQTEWVNYYSFAKCYHKNKTCRNVGNCFNEYTCTDCGYKETIDSSG